MPLKYDAKDAVSAWHAGRYAATLTYVEDSVSKKKSDGTGGNPMQVWTFEVYNDATGKKQAITEYVVIPAATFKIKQLARALGREQEFDANRFQADDHLSESVTVELKVEQQDGFDDKNRITKILPPAGAQGRSASAPPQTSAKPSAAPRRSSPSAAERMLNADPVAAGQPRDADAPPDDNIPF
ncbi:MAG TPA: hypothetical protein VHI52_21815 [Verrucomicrobiae bacterium]|nr:hypothetical protein [Verrucomicrobiae bacterium]